MARPKKEIDEKLLEKLAFVHLPDQIIADCLGISEWTLRRRYARKIDESKSKGKAKLATLAWAKAEKGDWAAIKFLLQNWLKMSDKIEQTVNADLSKPIVLAYSNESVKRVAKDEPEKS